MNNSFVKKASNCLIHSFYNYPLFTYLFPDTSNREKKIKEVITFLVKLGLKKGEVISSSDCEECTSIWYFPYDKNISFIDVITAGIIQVMLISGLKDFKRFMKLKNHKSKERRILLKDNKYYFLDMIGVNQHFQQKGLASSILNGKLREIKKSGNKCYLETSYMENVTFYQKFGFSLINEYVYDGLPVYCLLSD